MNTQEKQILKNLIKLHLDVEVTGLDSFISINNVLGYLMEHYTDSLFDHDVSKGFDVLDFFYQDLNTLKIVKQKKEVITKENLLIYLNETYGKIKNYNCTIKDYNEYFIVWTKKKVEWLYETDEINENINLVKHLCRDYMTMKEKCRQNLRTFEELQKQYEWFEMVTEGIVE